METRFDEVLNEAELHNVALNDMLKDFYANVDALEKEGQKIQLYKELVTLLKNLKRIQEEGNVKNVDFLKSLGYSNFTIGQSTNFTKQDLATNEFNRYITRCKQTFKNECDDNNSGKKDLFLIGLGITSVFAVFASVTMIAAGGALMSIPPVGITIAALGFISCNYSPQKSLKKA